MTAKVGDWLGAYTVTKGTGTILIGGALPEHSTFSNVGNGDYWYTIIDGTSKESGKGSYLNGKFTRTTIHSTMVGNVYTEAGAPISLTGAAEIYSTFTKAAFDEFTSIVLKTSNIDNTSDLNKPVSTLQQAAIDGKADSVHTHLKSDITDFSESDYATAAQGSTADSAIQSSEKAVANGVATLGAGGLIPAAQLPSFVDDVLEYANLGSLPVTGESGKIYITTDNSWSYRWTGSVYIRVNDISASDAKILYESNADTNAFTDLEKAFLSIGVKAVAKPEFDSILELNKSRLSVSGDGYYSEFESAYSFPVSIANQFTINASVKYINGVRCSIPSAVLTLPGAPDGLQDNLGGSDFVDITAAITAGGTTLSRSVLTRMDLVLAKLSLANYTANIVSEIQDKDENIFRDNGVLKQYSTSYIQHQGLRDYVGQSDAMAAFGYTQDAIDKGLWTDGTDYFIPIALVPRLNKGAYHPSYNQHGCTKFVTSSDFWYQGEGWLADSISYCFANNHATIGSIANGFSGRRTNDPYQFYDAIYAGQVKDLRISARSKTPNELIAEYDQKAKAGDIRGFESVPFTFFPVATHSAGNVPSGAINLDVEHNGTISVGDIGASFGNGTWYPVKVTDVDTTPTRVVVEALDGGVVYRTGGSLTFMISASKYSTGKFESLPWQDIIGSPANIAATFPDGVFGQWIPNSTQPFPLNRKALTGNRDYTIDNGATWISSSNLGTFNSTLNQVTDAYTASHVALLHYGTSARPYEIANNSEVVVIGDVFATCAANDGDGGALLAGLLGKVGTGAVSNSYENTNAGELFNFSFQTSNRKLGGLSTGKPEHRAFITTSLSSTSPTVKAFPYITKENGQYFLQWVYKEMVWDLTKDTPSDFAIVAAATSFAYVLGTTYLVTQSGASDLVVRAEFTATNSFKSRVQKGANTWTDTNGTVVFTRWSGNGFGDDNKFTIVNGESTINDNNNKKIIIGQKRVALPYFTNTVG